MTCADAGMVMVRQDIASWLRLLVQPAIDDGDAACGRRDRLRSVRNDDARQAEPADRRVDACLDIGVEMRGALVHEQ